MTPHTPMPDFSHCVIHAGSDKIHKLVYREVGNRSWLNLTRTECGCLTTHMSQISEKEAEELSKSRYCKRCFEVNDHA